MSLYCIQAVLLLDAEGERIACKYYPGELPALPGLATLKEQKARQLNATQHTLLSVLFNSLSSLLLFFFLSLRLLRRLCTTRRAPPTLTW